MSEKYKTTCKYLNYAEHLLILASTVNGCVSVSVFASSVAIPVGATSFAVGIKICAITAGIKTYKSITKKKKKKHDKKVLLGKNRLNTNEVFIFKALIDSYTSHDEFFSVNDVLRKYNKIKEEIKTPKTSVEYTT